MSAHALVVEVSCQMGIHQAVVLRQRAAKSFQNRKIWNRIEMRPSLCNIYTNGVMENRQWPLDQTQAPYGALAKILGRHFTTFGRPCYHGELYSLTY